jgi:carboxyl-terminal processing protease
MVIKPETIERNSELSPKARREVFARVLKALDDKFYKPELLGADWQSAVEGHRPAIENSSSRDEFEEAITDLLQILKTSHLGFFHKGAKRASSKAALSTAYFAGETEHGSRWIFQDVHSGGAAAIARIEPGDVLLRVNGKEIIPPEHPVFPMGQKSEVQVVSADGRERTATVEVARPKGKKLQFIEPTLVQSKILRPGIGYLQVAMFPGMIGVEVAIAISQAIRSLGNIKGLIIDLRGNTGGGVGALRVMSWLTPGKLPVGYAPGKKWAERDLKNEQGAFKRFDRIPSSKGSLWLLALRYLPTILSKSPVVLQTEGLGPQPYHGRIVLLVDRHTASAAEMITIFAKENKLATIVGERTAGRLLSATSVKVGHDYRLALPTGAYYTWQGTMLEGSPIEPDIVADFDWMERRRGIDGQLECALRALGDS